MRLEKRKYLDKFNFPKSYFVTNIDNHKLSRQLSQRWWKFSETMTSQYQSPPQKRWWMLEISIDQEKSNVIKVFHFLSWDLQFISLREHSVGQAKNSLHDYFDITYIKSYNTNNASFLFAETFPRIKPPPIPPIKGKKILGKRISSILNSGTPWTIYYQKT